MLGYSVDALTGADLHEAIHSRTTAGELSSRAECALCRAINTREPQEKLKGELWHKEGRAVPVSFSLAPFTSGSTQGAVISFSEISADLRIENEIRSLKAEIADAEQRRIEFIAVLAHELRNPLAPLRTALQMMRKATDNATSMAHLRDMMERQLTQMVHLVNDLLDIARVSTGQMVLRKERVALQEILRVAVEAAEPLMAVAQNSLTLDVPEDPLYLDADPTRLTQVFTNILNNAAQFSAPGGPISLHTEIEGETVRIDIADTGVGIAREALNRIFEMFTRVGRDTDRKHAGLGIGLNIARRLVEMHGGKLVATSEGRGRGSHFLVSLPLDEPAQNEAASAESTAPQAEPRGKVRALIVDDNIDAAASLGLLLELGGHATCIVHNGPDALKVVREFKPDVVLLDIGMPGMDGYEVARALRTMSDLGRPALVAVTGWGGPEDRLKSKNAGFDEHLTKPVDISMIELLLTTLPTQAGAAGGNPPIDEGLSIHTP
jgi:signal transduction histidine kinase/ActR/RegA family two-component response regulator